MFEIKVVEQRQYFASVVFFEQHRCGSEVQCCEKALRLKPLRVVRVTNKTQVLKIFPWYIVADPKAANSAHDGSMGANRVRQGDFLIRVDFGDDVLNTVIQIHDDLAI